MAAAKAEHSVNCPVQVGLVQLRTPELSLRTSAEDLVVGRGVVVVVVLVVELVTNGTGVCHKPHSLQATAISITPDSPVASDTPCLYDMNCASEPGFAQ